VPYLASKRKLDELSCILTLDDRPEYRAAVEAAVEALVAAGPKAKKAVLRQASSVAGRRHAAGYFERIVEIGQARYLGGVSELGASRSGSLVFTEEFILLGSERLIAVPAVASMEVGGGLAAKSKLLPALAFGVVGAVTAKSTKDRAEIVVYLESGEAAFFFVDKRSAAEVRAQLLPLMRRLDIPFRDDEKRVDVTEDSSAAGEGLGLADELIKLQKLDESGFLTSEELSAAKARLLG